MPTDVVILEIMNNKFRSIAEEMAYTLQRTGFTIFVNETADFGTGLVSSKGEMFGSPKSIGIACFIGLDFKDLIQSFESYSPGDVIIVNDPYTSGGVSSHLTDLNLLKPIFDGDQLVCFAWSYIHSTDVGGKVAGSISPTSYEVYQEGIRIIPTKLYRAGELNKDVLDLILANCRVPEDNWGDLKAILASLNTGESRVLETVRKYGRQNITEIIDELLLYAQARSEALIDEIPDGIYRFHDFLDDDVASLFPVRIDLKMHVSGKKINLDYSHSDVQLKSAFNIPSMNRPHPWITYRILSYLYSRDPQIPLNGGLFRPISVTLPSGSIVNCSFPAAVGVRTTAAIRVMDVIQGALSKAAPQFVPAASSGAITPIVLSEPSSIPGKRNVVVVEPLVGGVGAGPDRDGVDARDVGIANLSNIPIEIVEADAGVIIERYDIRCDSGGPGRCRGGVGVILEFKVLKPDTIITARGMERQRFQAWGVQGGKPGAPETAVLNPGRPNERNLAKIDVLNLEPNDVVRIITPGGGGYGHPCERSPEKVFEDVRNGFVSAEGARRDYGVVIKKDGGLDYSATEDLRRERSAKESFREYDFGEERENYDFIWPEQTWETLIELLYELPESWRPYIRKRILTKFKETKEPVTPDSVKACWDTVLGDLSVRKEVAT